MALNLLCEYPYHSSGKVPQALGRGRDKCRLWTWHHVQSLHAFSTLLLLFQHQLGSFIWSLEDKNRQQKEKLFAKKRGFVLYLIWKPRKPVEKDQRAYCWPGKHLGKWWEMMLRGLRNLSCEQRLGESSLEKRRSRETLQHFPGTYKGTRKKLFTKASSDQLRGNGFKLRNLN